MALGLAGVAAAAVPEKSGSVLPANTNAAPLAELPSNADVVLDAPSVSGASELQQQMAALVQTMQAEAVAEQTSAPALAGAEEAADLVATEPSELVVNFNTSEAVAAPAAEPVLLAQAVVPAAAVPQAAAAAEVSATAAGTAAGAGATTAAAGAGAAAAISIPGAMLFGVVGLAIAAGDSVSKDSAPSTPPDTAPPIAPTLLLVTDTGLSATDAITKVGTVNVTGLESGASWQYSTNGGGTWVTGSGSSFTLTGDGAKSVIVRQTDAAGNVGSASTPLAFTLDATIATPTVALATDTGTDTSDKLTNNAALSLSEKAADVTRSFTIDGGAASATYTAPTVDGAHTVVVTDTDMAGNTTSASLSFTLDKTIATPTLDLTSDTGTDTTDKLTSNAALSLSEKAADVTRSFTVDGGAASAIYTAPTVDGAHTVVVTDTDTAGNTASASLTFTLDTTAPAIAGMTAKKDTPNIDLAFDGPLDGANLPTADAFVVTQGTTTLAISSVALTTDGSGIRLTLGSNLVAGLVNVAYTDPSATNDANAIQDGAGNDSLGFTSGIVADGYVRGATVYIDGVST